MGVIQWQIAKYIGTPSHTTYSINQSIWSVIRQARGKLSDRMLYTLYEYNYASDVNGNEIWMLQSDVVCPVVGKEGSKANAFPI